MARERAEERVAAKSAEEQKAATESAKEAKATAPPYVYRTDLGESLPTTPIKTATDHE